MSSKMWKSTCREIKQSFGRFMAIFAITALGVSLFSGLKVLEPAMVETTDRYFKEKNFYNYRVLSELGFEDTDLEFLSKQEEVLFAEGIVSFDMLCSLEGESTQVIKIYNVPEQINDIEMIYGRMPENAKECIVDSAMYGEESLGRVISLSSDNTEDDLDYFKHTDYKIVGVAQTANYIQFERGNTSLGNGKIAGFMYIPKEAFDAEFYTEILVKLDENHKIYSDEYDAYMDEKEPVWESLAEDAATGRYDRLMEEAEEELADAKQELADGKAEGEAELADAEKELADAYKELTDAEKEIADAKQELADGRATLEENRKTLDDAGYEIGYNRVKLENAQEEIEENKKLLASASAELSEGQAKIDAGKEQLLQKKTQISDIKELIETCKNKIDQADDDSVIDQTELWSIGTDVDKLGTDFQALLLALEIDPSLIGGGSGQPSATTPEEYLLLYNQTVATIAGALNYNILPLVEPELLKAENELNAGQAEIDAGREQISDAKHKLKEAEAEIEDGFRQIEEGIEQWEDGMRQWSEGQAELLEGEAELADAEKELADGWAEYYDGLAEYEEGHQEFLTEIADAEQKIADAEEEIADIEEPDSYILGRETNVGYACMENDSAIVDGIANVLPVFFYAVAALVCMTTMSRMIEEQRTQIGVLKALGYSDAAIMGKYLFYSGVAAISGCLVGFFFGTKYLAMIIWAAYSTMYSLTDLVYVFDKGVLIFSLIVSALCSMGVTFINCKNELTEVAAELMRPKAPKAGKRIFLEYIPFIWKPMKFLHKVSYRNVFRYKRRFFMMVIGISGCTGLLVTGFGVRDSIANIANDQYDRIQVVDINVMLSDEVDQHTDELIAHIAGDCAKEYIYVMEKTINLVTDGAVKSLNLVAVDENTDISPYVMLPDDETGELLKYPKEGECILTNKLAKTYDLQVGDTVVFRDEDNHEMELKLSGIAENYLYNFAYMTTQTYEKCLGEKAEKKTIYMNLSEGVDAHQMTADLMKNESIVAANVSSDAKNRFSNMIDSLDMIIVVIIVSAGFLAFIVLYNLTNINITERIREIATIKVLGFYRNETASYVFRENLILTGFGAVAGLVLGKLFHAFVMSQVQVDQVSFGIRILPKSYLYAFVLTFVFAIVINFCMTGKLDKVSMTESLKSVD